MNPLYFCASQIQSAIEIHTTCKLLQSDHFVRIKTTIFLSRKVSLDQAQRLLSLVPQQGSKPVLKTSNLLNILDHIVQRAFPQRPKCKSGSPLSSYVLNFGGKKVLQGLPAKARASSLGSNQYYQITRIFCPSFSAGTVFVKGQSATVYTTASFLVQQTSNLVTVSLVKIP